MFIPGSVTSKVVISSQRLCRAGAFHSSLAVGGGFGIRGLVGLGLGVLRAGGVGTDFRRWHSNGSEDRQLVFLHLSDTAVDEEKPLLTSGRINPQRADTQLHQDRSAIGQDTNLPIMGRQNDLLAFSSSACCSGVTIVHWKDIPLV